MSTVLITGYEPFAGFDRNPSAHLAQALDGACLSSADVVGRVMPVDLRAMPGILRGLLDDYRPDVAIMLGLAAGSAAIAVERVGVNLIDLATTPDNAGLAVRDDALVEADDAPDALFATLPTRWIVERLREAGIPAVLSYSAGTHLCNAALYHALYAARQGGRSLRAGFLHLPLLPEQAATEARATPSMDAATMRRAVEVTIATTLDAGNT